MSNWDEDWGEDDAAETVPCPACGAEVYEDAPACPACGEYVTAYRSPTAGMPRWFAAAGLVGCVLLIVALVFGAAF